jgi:uncharacterized membrane protein YdjX (TVP38/TMEM64 family)
MAMSNEAFNLQSGLQQLLEGIQGAGGAGVVGFILLYGLFTVLLLPGTILTLSAGVIFGAVQGSIYAWIGATLGATLAFLTGRYLARQWVTQKIAHRSRFQAIDRAVSQAGLKIVLLTRLSPLFPFNLLNYAFGITGVSLRDYVLGSVGMIPTTILYVYIGSLAGNLTQLETTAQPGDPRLYWAFRIVGLLTTLAVTVFITQTARKALAAAAPEEPSNS